MISRERERESAIIAQIIKYLSIFFRRFFLNNFFQAIYEKSFDYFNKIHKLLTFTNLSFETVYRS